MIIAVVVFVVLLALGLALALADRVCLELTQRRASEFLSEPFGHPPTVRVHGTPFLTQALRGRYAKVELFGSGLQVGEMAAATLNACLYNAELPLRALLAKHPPSVPCEHVDGRIVLPYGELARISRIPGLTLTYANHRLVASASVPVPGVSQLARVSGEARLTVVGGAAWLQVRGLSVAGISLPSLVVKQFLPSLTVPIPLPRLPYGLRITEVKPVRAGLLVCGSAIDVVLPAAKISLNGTSVPRRDVR